MLEAFSRKLAEAGVPVWRTTLHLPRLHPQSLGLSYIWSADSGCAENPGTSPIRVRETDTYLQSPVAVVHETGECVRCRLVGPEGRPLPIRSRGSSRRPGRRTTSLMPMMFGAQSRALLGIGDADVGRASRSPRVALVQSVLPALSATVEILMSRQMTADLLTTYVGREASRRILDGQILLGKGMRLNAVILFCDMRDFSRHMETLPRPELGELMRDYFACVVESIEDTEGDILKFMGDGLLAIFPVGEGEEQELGLRARPDGGAEDLRPAGRDERRAARSQPNDVRGRAWRCMSAEMFYGNIGARARLDFTVMGPSVNRASRIERLCRTLGERILTSADFAAVCPVKLVSAGRHALKGIEGEHEIFVPLLDIRAVGGDD